MIAGRPEPPREGERAVRLHPRVLEASEGRLPEWAALEEARRAHAERVAELMGRWAERLGLPGPEVSRWRAAGLLHDALKDAAPEEQRRWAPAGTPAPLLHGLACAERLREEGVDDEALLLAVGYHTTGHPGLDDLGRSLLLADFLEPGRELRVEERRRLRERLPEERSDVLVEVVAWRLARLIEDRRPVEGPTVEFWNAIVDRAGGHRPKGGPAGPAAGADGPGGTTGKGSGT